MKCKFHRLVRAIFTASALLGFNSFAANFSPPVSADYIITNFPFQSGQTLPELRMHYITFGAPKQDAQGITENAVLILHGTTGSSGQFLGPQFAGELYGPGQPLDTNRYYLIIPDNIGHGKSR